MIVTRGLTKRYGHVLAVDQVDLDVRAGDRYGFLGPNGSGKTTVVRMLLGLVFATSGEIEVLGRPVPRRAGEVLPQIGSLVEGPSSYGHLSGRANLALLDAAGTGGARGSRRTRRDRIETALERVGLAGIDSRAVKKYSLGMRQRLGLAAALLRSPRLLILDEPTNGLDPQGIREVRDLLAGLNAAGTTVFLSSHQLSEVEQLCTRIGVVDRGRLVLQDDLDALRGRTGRVIVHSPDADRAAALLDGQVEHRDGDELIVAAGVGRAGRGQRPAGRRRGAGQPDRARAALAGAGGAGRDRLRLGPGGPGGPGEARVIRVELAKLARRPRSWVSVGLLCALPVTVAVFVAVTHLAPPPGQGPVLLSAVLSSGTLYPAAALAIVLPIFLPVAVAVTAGDAIAGEAGAGMLRYLLARPVGRTRLLVAKLVTLIVYVLFAVLAVALTSYAAGTLLFGTRPVAVTSGGPTGVPASSLGADHAVRHRPDPAGHRAADRRGDRVHRGVHARGRGHRAVPVHRSPTRRSAPRSARWPRWSPARCWSR